MTLVFDTSAWSAVLDGNPRPIDQIRNQSFDTMVLPLAVDAEIRFGFLNDNQLDKNLYQYELVKRRYTVTIHAPTVKTAGMYAELATWARQHGVALGNNDLWIAATTIELGGKLLTFDEDFKNLPQLRLA